MNSANFNKPSLGVRISGLIAATVLTAGLVGSQLGIAERYTSEADAFRLAGQVRSVALESSTSAPTQPVPVLN